MNKSSLLSQNNRNSKKDAFLIQLLSVVCLVGGLQIATQYFAHQFNYQPQLGAHLFHIYEPWAILLWANKWYAQYSGIFDLAAGFSIFLNIGLILVLIIKMMLANSSRTNQELHGSARWANKQDIVAAGLLSSGKNSKSNKSDAVYVSG